jgi:hypothetical protein
MDTGNLKVSGAAFPFEVPGQNLPPVVQELQIGGTGASKFEKTIAAA